MPVIRADPVCRPADYGVKVAEMLQYSIPYCDKLENGTLSSPYTDPIPNVSGNFTFLSTPGANGCQQSDFDASKCLSGLKSLFHACKASNGHALDQHSHRMIGGQKGILSGYGTIQGYCGVYGFFLVPDKTSSPSSTSTPATTSMTSSSSTSSSSSSSSTNSTSTSPASTSANSTSQPTATATGSGARIVVMSGSMLVGLGCMVFIFL